MTSILEHPHGFQLFFRHWEAQAPRAVVVLAHGMGEHTGRYAGMAEHFGKRGIAMLGADFPGFGRSSGKRGHAPGLDTLLDTLDIVLERAASAYPGVPVFLLGQSMGGLLALTYALDRKPSLAGILATSPWIRVRKMPPPPVMALARLMRRVYPSYTQSNGLDPRDFSRDPAVAAAYREDPLTHDRVSAGIGFSLLEAGLRIDVLEGPFPFPLLLTHGTADPLTDPSATEALSRRLTGPVTLRLWDGFYHETHLEPEKGEVLDFLANWIDFHTT
jgi:alpha-beta hydrolase superfamily lysophospholipase